jgi:hypothetical protein
MLALPTDDVLNNRKKENSSVDSVFQGYKFSQVKIIREKWTTPIARA